MPGQCGRVAPAADAQCLPKLGLPSTHHFLEGNNVPELGSDPWIRSDPPDLIYSQVWVCSQDLGLLLTWGSDWYNCWGLLSAVTVPAPSWHLCPNTGVPLAKAGAPGRAQQEEEEKLWAVGNRGRFPHDPAQRRTRVSGVFFQPEAQTKGFVISVSLCPGSVPAFVPCCFRMGAFEWRCEHRGAKPGAGPEGPDSIPFSVPWDTAGTRGQPRVPLARVSNSNKRALRRKYSIYSALLSSGAGAPSPQFCLAKGQW